MSQTPLEQASSLRIGTVDFVSPNEIKVALDIEAPESVALNSGGPRPFPRVHSYLLIACGRQLPRRPNRVDNCRAFAIS